jgi:hypothetical protein
MRHNTSIAVVFSLGLLLGGCGTSSPPPGSDASPAAAHAGPADGRNLAPELQRDEGADPLWPNDVNRGGGGGVR